MGGYGIEQKLRKAKQKNSFFKQPHNLTKEIRDRFNHVQSSEPKGSSVVDFRSVCI
jgi:hypothetical protein